MKNITFALLLMANLILIGCGETSTTTNQDDTITSTESRRVACVGDSITQGVGTSNPAKFSYPSQLAKALGTGWTIGNFGKSRSTLIETGDYPYTHTIEFISSQDFNPNIVVIMLGTNDLKFTNIAEIDRYISDYTALINTYKNLVNKPKIYVAYPTPSYGNLAGITNDNIVNVLLPKIQVVSQTNNVGIINVYNALLNKKELFPDTLHPNDEGAKIIADTVKKILN